MVKKKEEECELCRAITGIKMSTEVLSETLADLRIIDMLVQGKSEEEIIRSSG